MEQELAGAGRQVAVQRVLNTALAEGPQIVTRRGVAAAVLLPIEQWRRMERMTRPDLKELLLTSEATTENSHRRADGACRKSAILDAVLAQSLLLSQALDYCPGESQSLDS